MNFFYELFQIYYVYFNLYYHSRWHRIICRNIWVKKRYYYKISSWKRSSYFWKTDFIIMLQYVSQNSNIVCDLIQKVKNYLLKCQKTQKQAFIFLNSWVKFFIHIFAKNSELILKIYKPFRGSWKSEMTVLICKYLLGPFFDVNYKKKSFDDFIKFWMII